MTRIVLSQIAETIAGLFTGDSQGVENLALTHERLFRLQGVVDLVRQLPGELLAVSTAEFADC